MHKCKLALLALYMMLPLSLPAFAHCENKEGVHRHRHNHVVRPKKAKSTQDPWKLLALAFSPAYAASTSVNFSRDGYFRFVSSNGIPNHITGAFPNPGNPNSISEQRYTFRMLLNPKENYWVTPLSMYPFGVAVNGVPFDPGANEWYMRDRNSGWQYEAMALDSRLGIDQNNAHVQPDGAYHYHGLPSGLVNRLASAGRPILLGYAADGFPIYGPTGFASKHGGRLRSSYRIKSGPRHANDYGINPGGNYDGSFVQDYEYVQGLGDLDESNGKHAVTPEYPRGTYLYVITDAYPYIPRSFRGTPDQTFMNRGRSGTPSGRGYGYVAGSSAGYANNGGYATTGGYGYRDGRATASSGYAPQSIMGQSERFGPPHEGMGSAPDGMGPPHGGMGPPGGSPPWGPPDDMGPPPGFGPGGMGPPPRY